MSGAPASLSFQYAPHAAVNGVYVETAAVGNKELRTQQPSFPFEFGRDLTSSIRANSQCSG